MAKNEQKKAAALAALLESESLTEAAEKAGISRRTMYEYLHNDAEFANAYQDARNRQTIALMDELTEQRQNAQKVVMEILNDLSQPAATRLKAAQMILSEATTQEKNVSGIAKSNVQENENIMSSIYRFLDANMDE